MIWLMTMLLKKKPVYKRVSKQRLSKKIVTHASKCKDTSSWSQKYLKCQQVVLLVYNIRMGLEVIITEIIIKAYIRIC